MKVRLKSRILCCGVAFALCAYACGPKPADSDAAVGDADLGDLALDVVIPLTDSQQDTPALPDAALGDEIGDAADADAAEIVDVVIPPDELPDALAEISDVLDAADAAEIVDVLIPPDDIADVVDTGEIDQIADFDAAQLDQSEVADSTDAQKDTFLPVPDLGPCVSKDLTLYADSLSDDGTCTSACAPDHPCVCGDCAWVQTPPLVQQRWGASSVWTGTEIVMIGGLQGGIGYEFPITAERWNPKSDKGWEMIDTPPTKPTLRGVETHWDGTYVWAIVEAPQLGSKLEQEEYSFRWDPKTNTSVKLAMNGRSFATIPGGRSTVWAAGQFFEEGGIVQPGGGAMYRFSLYSAESDAWQTVAFPENLVLNNYFTIAQGMCLMASDNDIFIYN